MLFVEYKLMLVVHSNQLDKYITREYGCKPAEHITQFRKVAKVIQEYGERNEHKPVEEFSHTRS